jgi:hypothetical protein
MAILVWESRKCFIFQWELTATLPASPERSIPDTWVAVYAEDMGNTLGPKGFARGFEPASLVVEVSAIIIHQADEPASMSAEAGFH